MADKGRVQSGTPTYAADYAALEGMRRASALKGVFWSSLTVIVPTVVSAGVFVVSSRYLTPFDFGLVSLATSIASLTSAVAPAAFAEALIQRSSIERSHLDTVFWFCMAVAVLLYGALVLFNGLIASFIGEPQVALLLVLVGSRVLFDLAAAVPNALLARAMRFNVFALRTTVASFLSAAICIALLLSGFGLWALAISQITVSVVQCVASFASVEWRPGRDIRREAFRDVVSYGFYASGNRFMQLMSLDQIALGALVGPTALGIFAFARRLYLMLSDVIAGAFGSVSHTLLSSLQHDMTKVREAFLIATFGSATISFPVFAGLALIAGEAVPLVFDPKWSVAVEPLQAFCAIGLLGGIGIVQASLIKSQNKTHWWFYYQLVTQFSNLAIIVLFYDRGVGFVVTAMAVKTYLMWPASLVMTTRILGVGLLRYLRQFVPPLIAVVAMAAVILAARSGLRSLDSVYALTIEIALGGAVYLVVVSALSFPRIREAIAVVRKRRAPRPAAAKDTGTQNEKSPSA